MRRSLALLLVALVPAFGACGGGQEEQAREEAAQEERVEGEVTEELRQRQQTSYYSEKLAGAPTASGELYDPYAFTAAHSHLPLGTRLAVRCEGRSVVVTVNDRIPYDGVYTRRLGRVRELRSLADLTLGPRLPELLHREYPVHVLERLLDEGAVVEISLHDLGALLGQNPRLRLLGIPGGRAYREASREEVPRYRASLVSGRAGHQNQPLCVSPSAMISTS